MTFTERNQASMLFPPTDINGTGIATATAKWMNMGKYDHVTLFVQIGSHGAASTIKVYRATDASGTSKEFMAFNYRKTATTNTDDFGALTAATSAGVATDGATTKIIYAIEIDAQELISTTAAFDFVQVIASDPSAAMVVSVLGVGSKPKYASSTMPSAIA